MEGFPIVSQAFPTGGLTSSFPGTPSFQTWQNSLILCSACNFCPSNLVSQFSKPYSDSCSMLLIIIYLPVWSEVKGSKDRQESMFQMTVVPFWLRNYKSLRNYRSWASLLGHWGPQESTQRLIEPFMKGVISHHCLSQDWRGLLHPESYIFTQFFSTKTAL